ncbi:MAG: hypothetical protein ACE37M_03395 [Henriciella sp.]
MKTTLTALAVLTAPLVSPVALAQSDGILGNSSTGTLNFNVNISDANRVQIFGFGNLTQTIEAGQQRMEFRGNSSLRTPGTPGDGVSARPCITADLPGTMVSLDWAFTPLTSQTDNTKIIATPFHMSKDVTGAPGTGGITIIDFDSTTSPRSGTVSGIEAKTGGHGVKCRTDDKGRLGFYYGYSQNAIAAAGAGTYVSTITFTVKPQ